MGKESSGEGKLEKTIGQHDGCLLGEIFFFFFFLLGALSIAKGFLVPRRGGLLFIKFCSRVKFQVIVKITPKKERLGVFLLFF